jgi:hypothetical protein
MNIATVFAVVQIALALLKSAPLIDQERQALHEMAAKIRAGQQPTAEERAAFWQTLLKIVTQLAPPITGAAAPAIAPAK